MEGTDFGQSRFGHPDLTNFGQSNLGHSISGSGVCHGPKGWAQTQKKWSPEGWGPKGAAPKGGPEGWGAQNFALFFPSPTTNFALFISLCVFSWSFGGVWKRRGRQMCTFGVLGLLCEAPAAPKPPGFHTTALENSTRKHTVRDKKSEIGGGTLKKKCEILGGPAEGGPPEGVLGRGRAQGGQTNHKKQQTHSKTHTNTNNTNHNTTQHRQKWIGQNWLAKKWIGQSRQLPFRCFGFGVQDFRNWILMKVVFEENVFFLMKVVF